MNSIKKIIILLICTTSLCLSTSSIAKNETERNHYRLHELAEKYYNKTLELDPIAGTENTGDARYEDKLAITIAPAYLKKSLHLWQTTLKKLSRIDKNQLSSEDATTYAVLERELQLKIETDNFPSELLPINQYGGTLINVVQFGTGQDIQPLKTVTQYKHYLKRLERLSDWIDQAIINMRLGIKTGVVQHKALIEQALPAIKPLTLEPIENNPFYLSIKNMPSSFTAKEKQQVTNAYKKSIESRLIPAANKLYAFLVNEYLPHARPSAGIDALPNGSDWYKFAVKYHTNTNMTPDEIHLLGLREVERIHAEIEKIKAIYKFKGSLKEFLEWQDNAAENKPFKTSQEILDTYANLNNKIAAKLPTLFGRIPKVGLEIKEEPELTRATASDHYSPPTADGSRPGIYYAVIVDPLQYNKTHMTSLFLHEGQPGHHYQIALQQEFNLPKFRQFGWITAFGEGWALYAETLGHELGLYEDPNAYLGHLKLELVRAVRLVTDTGLHAKGWTREKTIQYMIDIEGRSEESARRATERYMAWPAQALAYKIGALKIQELRTRASQQLGTQFSLRDFHDLVLSEGVLPLNILEKKVDDWIASQKNL
jgi:uncharacterized protein (DUF885 family)